MTNKKMYIVGGAVGLGLIIAVSFFGSVSSTKTPSLSVTTNNNNVSQNTLQNTQPSNSVGQSDPEDIVPGTYPNKINNTSTVSGLAIQSGLVENNVDAQKKIANDHLELLLKNTSSQDMANFEAYYTIKDLTTGKSEGYYKKLTNFILKSGEAKSIHFDGGVGDGHFGVNKNGLYFISRNKLQFDIQVSTPNFKIAKIQIIKDAGGAEMKD